VVGVLAQNHLVLTTLSDLVLSLLLHLILVGLFGPIEDFDLIVAAGILGEVLLALSDA
jgi:hypothetical protein